jgi:hypothetical protein
MVGLNLYIHSILHIGELFNFGQIFSPARSLLKQYFQFVVSLMKIRIVALKSLTHSFEFLIQYLSVLHLFPFGSVDLSLALAIDIINLFVTIALKQLFLPFQLLPSNFHLLLYFCVYLFEGTCHFCNFGIFAIKIVLNLANFVHNAFAFLFVTHLLKGRRAQTSPLQTICDRSYIFMKGGLQLAELMLVLACELHNLFLIVARQQLHLFSVALFKQLSLSLLLRLLLFVSVFELFLELRNLSEVSVLDELDCVGFLQHLNLVLHLCFYGVQLSFLLLQ